MTYDNENLNSSNISETAEEAGLSKSTHCLLPDQPLVKHAQLEVDNPPPPHDIWQILDWVCGSRLISILGILLLLLLLLALALVLLSMINEVDAIRAQCRKILADLKAIAAQ
ncbi:hypothetical protein NEHOM01_1724 [Nematocida homosporus]|uniref:uncharacterized protein n=1 Tax=Nematocida homosporus TaxID=1912981 RepID=UPI00221F8237|nr:uncharacterized protein NEHOM01_1724 [Nematocida homosporus]KAI5186823.1 hypothetical protein NEHOM01_1724 [Nematocida homosporus]